jgi:multidrug efflux pump subunit AcrB
MFSFWTFFIRKKQFGFLVVIALFIFGLFSLLLIPKESSPEVKVPIAMVTTVLPGGSAADIEKLVTNEIEGPLRDNLDDVKKITSSSMDGVSSIVVEFRASADLDTSLQELRSEVDKVKMRIPSDAEDPQVLQIDLTDEPVINASIFANVPDEILQRLAEDLKDDLESLRSVSRVDVAGLRAREVQVLVEREALYRYGIDLSSVVSALASNNVRVPIGSIENDGVTLPVQFEGEIDSIAELEDVVITTVSGAPLYIRDVARVIDGRTKQTSLSRTSVNGEPANPSLMVNIYKTSNTDITAASKEIKSYLDSLQSQGGLLEDAQVLIMFDRGELLVTDLRTLGTSGLQTTMLVVVVLTLAIGWREALIAGLSIPLSFLVAFIALYYSGNTINFISLFSLVLAVGIIVDSAIVITEGINRHIREQGTGGGEVDKKEAAFGALREFYAPLIAGTMTTVAVFAPLLLVSGIVGEFIKGIPVTIIFILFASLFVSLMIVPLFAVRYLTGKPHIGQVAEKRRAIIGRLERGYADYLNHFLIGKKKTKVLFRTLIALFVFALMLPIFGVVQTIFFDSGDSEYVFVDVETSRGTSLSVTDIEMRKIEEVLYENENIESFVATVGALSPFTQMASSNSSNSQYANAFITLKEDRTKTSAEILDDIRTALSDIRTSKITVDQLEDGPPSADPIVIRFLGDDFESLDKAADDTLTLLSTILGVTDGKSSTRNNGGGFSLSVDRGRAAIEGVPVGAAGQNLRTALFGTDATKLHIDNEDIDVVVSLDLNTSSDDPHENNQVYIEALGEVPVLTYTGLTPLNTFTQNSFEERRAVIEHEDGKRVSSVSAKLTADGNTRVIISEFQSRIDELQLPKNVEVRVGGEDEDFQQSFKDMFNSLLIGMLSMFAILVLQFNSFRYALYVLAPVPLSLIGVLGGLMLVNKPISFPSMMGFIALAGIVVNNAIILIDTINQKRKEHDGDLKDAIIEASVSRLRPVILTAITTVVGIIPLLFTAALWIPLAFAIIFGLSFSTILTLILVPAMYYRWPGKDK